jgi:hypothetical protein
MIFSNWRHFFHPPKKMSQKKSTNVTVFWSKCHKKVRSNVSTIVSQNVHFRKIQKWRTIKVFQVKKPTKNHKKRKCMMLFTFCVAILTIEKKFFFSIGVFPQERDFYFFFQKISNVTDFLENVTLF